MKFILILFILFSVDSLSIPNLGGDDKFTSNEIKSIRNISRTLLDARRVNRDKIEQNVKPIREDFKKIEALLLQVKSSFGLSNNSGLVKSNAVKSGEVTGKNERISKEVNELIIKAKAIVQNRRRSLNDGSPRFYEFWKDEGEDSQRLKTLFSILEDKVGEIESSGDPAIVLNDTLMMLAPITTKNVKSQPTLRTITKHYFRGDK